MRRALLSLQILAMMCTPFPQMAYVAVGIGRTADYSILALLCLYAVASMTMFTVVSCLAARLGRPGLARYVHHLDRLPRWLRPRWSVDQVVRGPATMFTVGYVNLYLAAVLAGLRRERRLLASALGVSGDLVQFTLAVLLARELARLLPVPASDWVGLLLAPLLLAAVPAGWRLGRRWLPALLGQQPRPPQTPACVPVQPD